MQNSSYDWKYYTEPSKHFGFGLNGGVFWPRGKLLGGCGAINAMLYVRGVDRDFEEWKNMGNPSWGYENVLPYFKKSEINVEQINSKTENYHGFDGLLNIETYGSSKADKHIKNAIAGCFAELDFKKIDDINANEYLGYTYAQGTLEMGTRYSTAKGFLNRGITDKRENLHIMKYAHVTKININESTKEVESIDFFQTEKNVKMNVKVKKETILSAGTVNTPQLLMLSGIGPENHLKKFNIKMIENVKGVGKNLQDHLITPYIVSFHKSSPFTSTVDGIANEYFDFLLQRKGIFSNLGSTDLMAFMSTVGDEKYPDIQFLNFLFTKGSTDTLNHLLSVMNFKKEIIDSFLHKNDGEDVLLIVIVLLKPKSKGFIKLQSSDPFDAPKIFANYLQEPEDVQTVIRAMKTLQKMSFTESFKRHEGEIVSIKLDGCNQYPKDSNEYLECYVRHMSITLYHPVGTAKMGNDSISVVNERLEVKGVKGLRVADASVMPTIVSANTNAATIMIGERVVDFINKDEGDATKNEL